MFVFHLDIERISWDAISAIVLSFTALFIYKQAKASSALIQAQLSPSIEIFMIRVEGGNSFFIYNSSKVPGRIMFDTFFRHDESSSEQKLEKRKNYRMPPEGSMITANTFFKKLPEGVELKEGSLVRIRVSVSPDFDGADKNLRKTYTKTYEYKHDRWDEKSVGFPDYKLFRPIREEAEKELARLRKKAT